MKILGLLLAFWLTPCGNARGDEPLSSALSQAQQVVSQKPAADAAQDDPLIIGKSRHNTVQLRLSIRDKRSWVYYTHLNSRILELGTENFVVKEKGKKQVVTDLGWRADPVSWGLGFDVSGSMQNWFKKSSGDNKKTNFERAQEIFAKIFSSDPDLGTQRLRGDEYVLVTFRDQVQIVQGQFSKDLAALQSIINLQVPGGLTALNEAMLQTLEMLDRDENTLGHPHNPRKAMLIVTDGEDTNTANSYNALLEKAQEADAQIFIILVPGTQKLFEIQCRDPQTGAMRGTGHRVSSFRDPDSEAKTYCRQFTGQNRTRVDPRANSTIMADQDQREGIAEAASISGDDADYGLRFIGPEGYTAMKEFVEKTGGWIFPAASDEGVLAAIILAYNQTRYRWVLSYQPGPEIKEDNKEHAISVEIKDYKKSFPKDVLGKNAPSRSDEVDLFYQKARCAGHCKK